MVTTPLQNFLMQSGSDAYKSGMTAKNAPIGPGTYSPPGMFNFSTNISDYGPEIGSGVLGALGGLGGNVLGSFGSGGGNYLGGGGLWSSIGKGLGTLGGGFLGGPLGAAGGSSFGGWAGGLFDSPEPVVVSFAGPGQGQVWSNPDDPSSAFEPSDPRSWGGTRRGDGMNPSAWDGGGDGGSDSGGYGGGGGPSDADGRGGFSFA